MQKRGFEKPANTVGLRLASRGGWMDYNSAKKAAIWHEGWRLNTSITWHLPFMCPYSFLQNTAGLIASPPAAGISGPPQRGPWSVP